MALHLTHRRHSSVPLVRCPWCGHIDLPQRPLAARLAAHGRPRACACSLDEYVSPLRNETCGCLHPLHSGAQAASHGAGGKR